AWCNPRRDRSLMSTILIVDDLSANRAFLVTLLRYKGHRVLEAADGREALAVVADHHPDLVVTDVLMPVMDGYELLRRLRLERAARALPAIFYPPHYGEREARAFARASAVSALLTKPAEPDEVLRILDRVFSDEGQITPAADPPPLTPAFDREHLR